MTEPIWELPFPSQELEEGPVLHHQYGELLLRLEGPSDSADAVVPLTLRFAGVVAHRFLTVDQCREVHLDAYDKLIEVDVFDWGVTAGRRRLRLFLDDVGCYDVACEEVTLPDP